jgi:hypothetical protein
MVIARMAETAASDRSRRTRVGERGDEGSADRRGDHSGDGDQADAGRATVVESDHRERHRDGPLPGQRPGEGQLRPAQLGLPEHRPADSPGGREALQLHGLRPYDDGDLDLSFQ